jgi:hypothetical protein
MKLWSSYGGACLISMVAFLVADAGAQSLSACEVSVDYKIAALGPGAPAAAAALQGVWLGSWDGVLCSALIIESISSDGTIKAWYINGRYAPWYVQPGKSQWTGKLSDKKLAFKGSRVSVDYTVASPTQLNGIYSNNSGQYKGTFTKK